MCVRVNIYKWRARDTNRKINQVDKRPTDLLRHSRQSIDNDLATGDENDVH